MTELVGRPLLYRLFDGTRYTVTGSAWNKQDADASAHRYRSGGYAARIVKNPEAGYFIYVRDSAKGGK
jgi:hypothetical protein